MHVGGVLLDGCRCAGYVDGRRALHHAVRPAVLLRCILLLLLGCDDQQRVVIVIVTRGERSYLGRLVMQHSSIILLSPVQSLKSASKNSTFTDRLI